MYLPFSKTAKFEITVKKDANVQEVIGYTLYEYVSQALEPRIPKQLYDTSLWSIRIAEDDGTIDDDFPALDRSRQIHRFGYDNFALCPSIPLIDNDQKRSNLDLPNPSNPTNSSISSGSDSQSDPKATVSLRIHLYATLELRQTTTIMVPVIQTFKDVFDQLCTKFKYDPKEYVLKFVNTMTIVPMDKKIHQLEISDLCIVKKPQTGDGDVFHADQKSEFKSAGYLFKEYVVMIKNVIGKYERILTIDNDYFHLVSNSKNFLDREAGKTRSYPLSSIISCKQSQVKKTNIKIVIKSDKANGLKQYEFEALSIEESEEICKRIRGSAF